MKNEDFTFNANAELDVSSAFDVEARKCRKHRNSMKGIESSF